LPFKVYAEIALLVIVGIWVGGFLSIRLVRALSGGRAKIGSIVLFVLFVAGVLFLGSVFLPCFSLNDSVICHGPRSEKIIALTFDDGPNEPYTSRVLDLLEARKIPATFFLVGKNVERYPDVVHRMLREGYPVGNHTWDHRPLIWMGPEEIRGEVEKWEEAMASTGLPLPSLKLFRAPHGWKTPFVSRVLHDKGYRLVGWSRGVWDSDQPGTAVLFRRLTRGIGSGDIILLHDGGEARAGIDRSQTVEVLPEIIDHYQSLGFRFVSLQEVLE